MAMFLLTKMATTFLPVSCRGRASGARQVESNVVDEHARRPRTAAAAVTWTHMDRRDFFIMALSLKKASDPSHIRGAAGVPDVRAGNRAPRARRAVMISRREEFRRKGRRSRSPHVS